MSERDLILGVDGGGTKTVAWLAAQSEQTPIVIGKGSSGSSNCRSVGFDRAIKSLDQAIDAAIQDTDLTAPSIAAACLSLAGADRPIEQQQFRSWADSRKLAEQVVITNDALPVLYAVSPTGVGIALISGTGSIAVGRNAAGNTERCGGWGSLLGDEGSGYQIALAGLKATVRAADGRGPQTDLLPNVMNHFELDDASELVPMIYAPETNRSSIAALAPLVFKAADSGDTVAKSIVEQAAGELTEMVATLARRLELGMTPWSLAISGGVLLCQASFVNRIRQRLIAVGLANTNMTPVSEPVAGAINIAMQATDSK